MGEPQTLSAGGATVRERDDLVATKVNIPRLHPDRVGRSRLLDALETGLARQLVLVSTPAGFGKTTLLADWAGDGKRRVAWLSLDPEDNDPTRFWRYVVAALDRACGGFGEQVHTLLAASSVASSRVVATALINELEAVPDELVLILDDYHVLESPAVHNGIRFLLNGLPRRLHVVIASRSDPPLPLARFRANGRLAELRAADLRFTPQETAAFLREVWKLDLSEQAVAALETRTEGWAVGLQLAALSLRERPDPDAFLDAFTGSHRYVLDYLSEEVLERQPDRVRTFLLQTSILERLSGPLCDAVTGETDGQEMLEELERANLFLVPLDEQRRWYRLHHLFADVLRVRLLREGAGRVRDLHRRAAAWCEQHGLVDDAIRHAAASGEATWATRLVERHLNVALQRGEGVIVERWLSALPQEAVHSNPGLCLAQGLMEVRLGHTDAVERCLDHAERAFDHQQEQPEFAVPTGGGVVAEIPAAIALLRAELAGRRGDVDGMAAFARSAATQMAEDEHGPRLWARWLLACADRMGGRLADAEPAFAAILAEGRTAPAPYPMMSSSWTLARVQQARGKLSAALRTYREGLRVATGGGRPSTYHAGEAHVGIAQVLYERNELDGAFRHVTAGIELSRQMVELTVPVFGLVTLAWIRQAAGDATGAVEAVNEACRIHSTPDVVAMWTPGPAERARLLLAQGRTSEAARWVEERGLTEDDEVSHPRELDHLMLARVLLARSDPGRALRLLERLDALAESQGRGDSLIRIRALRSLALQTTGDHQAALAVLAEAVSLARPEGYIRVFVDEGPPMAALLRSFVTARHSGRAISGAARGYVHRVVQAFRPAVGQAPGLAPATAGLIEALTDRELEVLRLVDAGLQNREIAKELVVTLETVKKHLSHIFRKLEASSRTQAVARARELGLISSLSSS